MVKNIKMGKISLPMDVNSSSAVPAFENMLTKGPMAVVLVYADWCGHCDKYKKNIWSPLKSVKNRTINMASIREDMLPNTSLKNAKIDGYPSILVVGKDKKPAIFNSSNGNTNALPQSNDVSTMKSLITSPVAEEVNEPSMNAYSMKNGNVNMNYPSIKESNSLPTINSSMENSSMENSSMENSSMENSSMENSSMENSSMENSSMGNSSMGTGNYTPLSNNTNVPNNNTAEFSKLDTPTASNTLPPLIEEDEVNETNSPRTSPANNQGTTPILRGGRLFRKLSNKYRKTKNRTKRVSKRKN
jgi:thiol-disulfide isomerase/thioredoxin